MSNRRSHEPRTRPSVLDGRFLIEIQTWDWAFFLGASSRSSKGKLEPELIDARGITIDGRILAPSIHRAKKIRVFVSPIRSDYVLRADQPPRIGELLVSTGREEGWDFDAVTHIPEETLGPVIQCLSTIWRYVHLWDDGRGTVPAPIINLTFSRDVPAILRGWIIS